MRFGPADWIGLPSNRTPHRTAARASGLCSTAINVPGRRRRAARRSDCSKSRSAAPCTGAVHWPIPGDGQLSVRRPAASSGSPDSCGTLRPRSIMAGGRGSIFVDGVGRREKPGNIAGRRYAPGRVVHHGTNAAGSCWFPNVRERRHASGHLPSLGSGGPPPALMWDGCRSALACQARLRPCGGSANRRRISWPRAPEPRCPVAPLARARVTSPGPCLPGLLRCLRRSCTRCLGRPDHGEKPC